VARVPCRAFGFLLLALLGPGDAGAAATTSLSWDACAPIQRDAQPIPGKTEYRLHLTVTGFDVGHMGYDIRLWFSGEQFCPAQGIESSVPDAWRFDVDGCGAGTEIGLSFDSPPDAGCPPIAQGGPFYHTRSLRYGFEENSGPLLELRVSADYGGGYVTPDPNVRYLLATFVFDHAGSVVGPGTPGATCGGLEGPVCFTTWWPSTLSCSPTGRSGVWYYRASDGQPVDFGADDPYATFGAPGAGPVHCFAVVPARNATWGAIKSRYLD
jgi:hypothetical protein